MYASLVRCGALRGAHDPRQHALATPQRSGGFIILSRNDEHRRRCLLACPFDGPSQQIAVRIFAEDLEHRHLGEHARGRV
jgi:hypothetical protein